MALSRRGFLKIGALAGGGLLVGFTLSGCTDSPLPEAPEQALQPNAWLQVLPDNRVLFLMHKAEMGQGVYTGLSTIVAEELDLSPDRLEVHFAPVHPDFRDPMFHLMVTGGSTSVSGSFDLLRQAAASTRGLLLSAASKRWRQPVESLRSDNGMVYGPAGEKASYGELAIAASSERLEALPALKQPNEYKYIGQFDRRLDAAAKITGSAVFGLDVMPEALTAVVVRCPQFGGSLGAWDPAPVKRMPGVVDVFQIETGIAVVADGYWHARKASEKLSPNWLPGPLSGWSSERIRDEFLRLAREGEATVIRDDTGRATSEPGTSLEAEYHLPYLAHATMEPMNAVVSITDEACEVWAGTQSPDVAQDIVARVIGRPREFVKINNTFLGGGFGRRVIPDYIAEAAAIALRLKKPVKLVWSREDDMRHDRYRPAFSGIIKAELSSDGRVQRWHHRLVGPSVNAQAMPVFGSALFPLWMPHALPKAMGDAMAKDDRSSVEGAKELPYLFDNILVDNVSWDVGVPLGYWRSVGHSHTAFVVESFVDEIAHALKQDPLDFRLAHLPTGDRRSQLLQLVAEKAGWNNPPQGRSLGIAVHESFNTAVAQVAEVSVVENRIIVHRVVCAVDCGQVINPDIVRSQIESGIIFGLTAAIKSEITIEDGIVKQGSFDDYPLLRMDECPDIEVHILPSVAPPTGVGEPGTPPIAPAVANAVFKATGQRLRTLPLHLKA